MYLCTRKNGIPRWCKGSGLSAVGSAHVWGARGRWFESSSPDQMRKAESRKIFSLVFLSNKKQYSIMMRTMMTMLALLALTACQRTGQPDRVLLTAARSGDAKAQLQLALAYDSGEDGVEQDFAEAARWYLAAAEQGMTEAMNNLGVLYKDGQGVAQDYHEAATWFSKAAEQGNILALSNLGWILETGYGLAQDYVEAGNCYRRAARRGHAAAQNNLARMFRDGLGMLPDADSARYWFEEAARQGLPQAQYNLAMMLLSDSLTAGTTSAFHWLRQAARQGHTGARRELKRRDE